MSSFGISSIKSPPSTIGAYVAARIITINALMLCCRQAESRMPRRSTEPRLYPLRAKSRPSPLHLTHEDPGVKFWGVSPLHPSHRVTFFQYNLKRTNFQQACVTSTRRGRTGGENSTAPLWLSHAAWVSLPCLSPFVLRNTLSRCFGGRTQLVERAGSAALLAVESGLGYPSGIRVKGMLSKCLLLVRLQWGYSW